MSTLNQTNPERAEIIARAKAIYQCLKYKRFFSRLGQQVEERSVEIAQGSKPTHPVLFLTESRFINELEKILDHKIDDCSMSELKTLIDFSIALAHVSGLTFQKISDIQHESMGIGSKQSVEQRHRHFFEKLTDNGFCRPEFADLIFSAQCSVKEAIHLLTGWSGNLIQEFHAALYLTGVRIDQIEDRIQNKIRSTPKNMYSLSNSEYVISIIVYLFLQRIHANDLDKLTPELAELVKIDTQHLSANQHLADRFCIGYHRGLSYDGTMQELRSLVLGRLDHELQYVVSNVAFIPHSLNSSVKTNGNNTEVIQFHDGLIENRAAIAVLLADEPKRERANLKNLINFMLSHPSVVEKIN